MSQDLNLRPAVEVIDDMFASYRKRIAELERENAELRQAALGARQVLWRYRHETPVANQPYMIAAVADKAIKDIDAAMKKGEGNG